MRISPLVFTLSLLAVACGDDTSPGAVGGVSLALTGGASSSEPAGADARGTRLTIDSASAHVRHIELDLPDGRSCADLTELGRLRCDSSSNKLVLDGPFVFDLVAGTSRPSLADVRVPPGTYKRVDVRFDDAKPVEGLVSSGDRLADQTMVAEGRMEVSGQALTFDLQLKFNEDARFETASGVQITEESAATLQLLLDASSWFSSLPLTDCIENGDLEVRSGRVAISDRAGGCSDVENRLKESIKGSGQLDRRD